MKHDETRVEGRASRAEQAKRCEPAISKAEGRRLKAEVSEFEKQTSYCPLYLAWRIVMKEICETWPD